MTLSLATPTVGARLRHFAALAASTLVAVSPVLASPPAAPQAATGTIKGRLVWAAGAVPKPRVLVFRALSAACYRSVVGPHTFPIQL